MGAGGLDLNDPPKSKREREPPHLKRSFKGEIETYFQVKHEGGHLQEGDGRWWARGVESGISLCADSWHH